MYSGSQYIPAPVDWEFTTVLEGWRGGNIHKENYQSDIKSSMHIFDKTAMSLYK